jgi:hypothetical protein
VPFRGVLQLLDDIGAWGVTMRAKVRHGEMPTARDMAELQLMINRVLQLIHGDPSGSTPTGTIPKLERPGTDGDGSDGG